MPSFSRGLEKALHKAMDLARENKHEFATLEHLLLALLDERDTVAVLTGCDVDVEALRQDLTDFVREELDSLVIAAGQDPRPTAAFQRVIQRAVIHVQSSGGEEVKGGNVLVAIFAERESHAAYFLEQQDISRLDAVNFITHGITKSEPLKPRRVEKPYTPSDLYDDDLNSCLEQAQAMAIDDADSAIRPEHLLSALCEDRQAKAFLIQSGVKVDALSQVIESARRVQAEPYAPDAGPIRWSAEQKSAMVAALGFMQARNASSASSIDALYGILAGKQSNAQAQLLASGFSLPAKPPTPEPAGPDKPDKSAPAPRRKQERFIFLSYAHDDAELFGRVQAVLDAHGIKFWCDTQIGVSDGWRQTIAQRLKASAKVLVLWTPSSVTSDSVCEEAQHGKASGKLVQAVFDDAKLPYGFSEEQYVKVRNWTGAHDHQDIVRVLDALKKQTRSEIRTGLMTGGRTAAKFVGGRVGIADRPPNAKPEIVDPDDLLERLHAQCILIDHIAGSCARGGNAIPPELPVTVSRYRKTLTMKRRRWYAVDDAASAIEFCFSQYDPEQWPHTLAHDLRRLLARHGELKPLLMPRQPPAKPDAAAVALPEVDIEKVDVAAVTSLLEKVHDETATANAGLVLDPSAVDASAHFAESITDALADPGGTEQAEARRRRNFNSGLRGLGSIIAALLEGTARGLKSSKLKSPKAAEAVRRSLATLFDLIVRLF